MAVKIELKRSAVPGKVPTTSSLELGELAVNTYDGKIYLKKDVLGVESIIEVASTSGSVVSASYALNATSASYAINSTSASYAITASYAMNSGGGGTSNITIADNNVTQGTASYFDFIGDGIITVVSNNTASITISTIITGSTSFLNQTTPATTWSFVHNLNSKYVNFEIYDSTDYVIIPQGIKVIDQNNAEIYFSSNRTGKAVAQFSGIDGMSNALSASYATNALSASYALTASYAINALTASSALNASDILIYVKNSTGAQIDKGKVVLISGAVGDNPLISTASYINDNNSANTLGITNENIPNDSFGYVITEGRLIGINTDTFTAGQLIYLGDTGSIIGSAPVAPLHAVRLGQVLRSQLNNGSIYVRIDNGFEIGELHDVKDTSTTSSYGDLLVKSGSIWINSKQLTGSYELTGSLNSTSFTGSLQGTASWANNAISSSYTSNADLLDNRDSTTFANTGSNIFIGNQTISTGYVILSQISSSLNFTDDTAAAVGGVPLGGLYRNGNFILIRLI